MNRSTASIATTNALNPIHNQSWSIVAPAPPGVARDRHAGTRGRTAAKKKGETLAPRAVRRACEGLAFSPMGTNRTVRLRRSPDDSAAQPRELRGYSPSSTKHMSFGRSLQHGPGAVPIARLTHSLRVSAGPLCRAGPTRRIQSNWRYGCAVGISSRLRHSRVGCCPLPRAPRSTCCLRPPPRSWQEVSTLRRTTHDTIWRDTPPTNADGTVNAYIEIARGDRRKWEFDMRANARAIDRMMPEEVGGYPVNYGFVPQTVSYRRRSVRRAGARTSRVRRAGGARRHRRIDGDGGREGAGFEGRALVTGRQRAAPSSAHVRRGAAHRLVLQSGAQTTRTR